MTIQNKNILLIVSGGIAAVKVPELIRLIKKADANVTCVLTQGGAKFVTPLSLSSLSENPVYSDLWSLKDESEMGHIRLSREADVILVAPASANIIAKMAHGLADDLATTTLLASDKPVFIAPAMNHKMWEHPATQDNINTVSKRGVQMIGPESGDMACGEFGMGRMCEPHDILSALNNFFLRGKLNGKKVIITAGPTYEPIDPVRFISNHSSGKQGYAIAQKLCDEGADVTLISGPVHLPAPRGVKLIPVTTAYEMYEASLNALPADIAICTAAVADWTPAAPLPHKMKKRDSGNSPHITLTENPDILKSLSTHIKRPQLVIGFAAETDDIAQNAAQKLKNKGCDWILANHVGDKSNPVFGADENQVMLVTRTHIEDWPRLSKTAVAEILVQKIIAVTQDKDIDENEITSRKKTR